MLQGFCCLVYCPVHRQGRQGKGSKRTRCYTVTQLLAQTYELCSLNELNSELNKRGYRLNDNGAVVTGNGNPACAEEVRDLEQDLESLLAGVW